MAPDADLLILGGGCAGLSLGARLAEDALCVRRTIILEARDCYEDDRTWCFWRTKPHKFEHLVSQSWNTVALGAGGRQVRVACPATPYQMVPSRAFYAQTQETIERSSSVDLFLETTVHEAPRLSASIWHVETSGGPMTARHVVDTRPPRSPRMGDALLWQSFFGQEIECDAAVFDPSTANLMDFEAPDDNNVFFRYVLPLSPYRALVETTVFGPQPVTIRELAARQMNGVDCLRRGASYRVLRTENGQLPMGTIVDWPDPGPGYVRGGIAGGAARPSTGYAFQRIQRWAERAAAAIRAGAPPLGHPPDPVFRRAMDHLFLRVMRSHPERAPDLFIRMFGVSNPASVIRFLSDEGSLADYFRIVAVLPKRLFLGELLGSIRGTQLCLLYTSDAADE